VTESQQFKRAQGDSHLVRQKFPSVRVDVAGLSHAGRVRPNNEDHFLIARFGRLFQIAQTNLPESEAPPSIEEGGTAMVVADGIGGHAAGERASLLAITTLHELVMATPDWLFRLNDDRVQTVMRRARERIAAVDGKLAEIAESDPELKGFGTTMTVAFNNAGDLFVASIGDSRAYLMRQGKLRAITRDHTVAQELADQGLLDPNEVRTHHYRHALTRALGHHGGTAETDVQGMGLADGDRLLLCTDGLTDMVGDAEIEQILKEARTARRACRRLIDCAISAGGADNVTAVVAFYRVPDSNIPAEEARYRT
jgi:serine/threonine protein phosphatase PrpC